MYQLKLSLCRVISLEYTYVYTVEDYWTIHVDDI